jgi:NAD(P)-dependent dehydrogenase (short-subunit alcohol dehydrogenase family)
MELAGKVAVVTGGGNGIGGALARRFASEGARVMVADIDAAAGNAIAEEIGSSSCATDVAIEDDVIELVRRTEAEIGPIDLFASNAGIAIAGGVEATNEQWQRIWDVNVMAHVYAARAVLPSMLDRGEGYLLQTVSAAGLLTNIGAAPYSVTKHAALGLAEWLSVTFGDEGIKVSALCPQGVATDMLVSAHDRDHASAGSSVLASGRVLQPEEVAEVVVEGLRDERFLILPHPEVAGYFGNKAVDYERWLGGMRRLQARVRSDS